MTLPAAPAAAPSLRSSRRIRPAESRHASMRASSSAGAVLSGVGTRYRGRIADTLGRSQIHVKATRGAGQQAADVAARVAEACRTTATLATRPSPSRYLRHFSLGSRVPAILSRSDKHFSNRTVSPAELDRWITPSSSTTASKALTPGALTASTQDWTNARRPFSNSAASWPIAALDASMTVRANAAEKQRRATSTVTERGILLTMKTHGAGGAR